MAIFSPASRIACSFGTVMAFRLVSCK